MGKLLDQIQTDNAVFLDTSGGFAETRDVDGVLVAAVLEPLPVGRAEQQYPGVLVRRRRLFVPAADIAMPVPGQEMLIDGEPWIVEDAGKDAGMLEVFLTRYDS